MANTKQPAGCNASAGAPPSRAFDAPEEAVWHRMISEAAYYRSQKPEFAEESALDHWLAAEEEIRVLLAGVSTGAVSMPAPRKREAAPDRAPPTKPRTRS